MSSRDSDAPSTDMLKLDQVCPATSQMSSATVEMVALRDFPLVKPGQDLADLIISATERNGIAPRAGDVIVIAQKVVSKSENRLVDLRSVAPSARAMEVATEVDKDPRLVEVILSESTAIIRKRKNVLIVLDRRGFVVANAGVDQSNTAGGEDTALLLPIDCDASADRLRERLTTRFGVNLPVVINDSFGRSWRRGTVGVAVGSSGLPALLDKRGTPDLFGRTLQSTEIGYADEIAAAASLIMGQAAEGRPVVLIRGLSWSEAARPGRDLIRPAEEDLFR
jgi:coenzyme F420-0:L-glutamate ligase / coenzyme F420-1:gamma-L-glutamate ligase